MLSLIALRPERTFGLLLDGDVEAKHVEDHTSLRLHLQGASEATLCRGLVGLIGKPTWFKTSDEADLERGNGVPGTELL